MKLVNAPEQIAGVKENDAAINLGWSLFDRAGTKLASELSSYPHDSILIMVRGGMTLASQLAHHLEDRKIHFFQGKRTASNNPKDYCDLTIVHKPSCSPGERVLIVEDIVYKGVTTHAAIKELESQGAIPIAVCTLILDEQYIELPDTSKASIPLLAGYMCRAEQWIRFPWEVPIKGEQEAHVSK